LAHKHRANIIDASTGNIIRKLAAPNVFEIHFSPRGTYVITWQRPWKEESGAPGKNLKVWRLADGEDCLEDANLVVAQFSQKSQSGRNLQYTNDEQLWAFIVTNELHFYQIGDLQHVRNKLRVEGLVDFAISPGEAHSVAIFVPERKVSKLQKSERFLLIFHIGATCRRENFQLSRF
jgi:translation initiation factor 2A